MKINSSNRSLKQNALLNGIKQGCAILFPLISFAYVSRVLGAEKVGIYSFGNSVVSYFSLIAALGISNYAIREGAIVRKEPAKISKFSNEVFSINLIMTSLSYCLLVIILLASDKLYLYRYTILIQSISIILTTLGADWINSVYEDYLYITVRYIAVQVLSFLAMLVFVRSADDLYRYIVISMLASSGGNILNMFYIRKYVKLRFTTHTNIKKHLPSMLVLFCNNIASVIYLNSDITLLGMMTSDRVVGIYTISSKAYSVIKTLLNAVIMVTVPRFSNLLAEGKKDEYNELSSKIVNMLLMFVFPCAVGMFFEASNILYLFGGMEYVEGETVLRILSIAMIFAVGGCFFCYSVLIPNHEEKKYLVATIVAAAINIILNFAVIPVFGMEGAATTTLLAEIAVFLISGISAHKKVKIVFDKIGILVDLVGTFLVAVVCITIKCINLSRSVELALAVFSAVVVYFVVQGLGMVVRRMLHFE